MGNHMCCVNQRNQHSFYNEDVQDIEEPILTREETEEMKHSELVFTDHQYQSESDLKVVKVLQ